MLKRIDVILISIVLLLGVVHTACTPIFYKSFSLSALWFAGTGLSFIFLGLIHIVRFKSGNRIASVIAFGTSIIATVFSVLIVILLSAPQAFIALIANIFLAMVSGVFLRNQYKAKI